MKKCCFCKNEVGGSRHIYCCKYKPENLTQNEIKLLYLQYNFPAVTA